MVQIQLFGHNFKTDPWIWKSKAFLDSHNQMQINEGPKHKYYRFLNTFI